MRPSRAGKKRRKPPTVHLHQHEDEWGIVEWRGHDAGRCQGCNDPIFRQVLPRARKGRR